MIAQTRYHADNDVRQLGELLFDSQAFHFIAKRKLPIEIEADDVKNVLADIDADRGEERAGLGHCSSS
jgi:hypothetical protein